MRRLQNCQLSSLFKVSDATGFRILALYDGTSFSFSEQMQSLLLLDSWSQR